MNKGISLKFRAMILWHKIKKYVLFDLFPNKFAYDYFGNVVLYPKYLTPINDGFSEVLFKIGGKNKTQYVQLDISSLEFSTLIDIHGLFKLAFKKAEKQGIEPKVFNGQKCYDVINGSFQRVTILA